MATAIVRLSQEEIFLGVAAQCATSYPLTTEGSNFHMPPLDVPNSIEAMPLSSIRRSVQESIQPSTHSSSGGSGRRVGGRFFFATLDTVGDHVTE